MINKDFWGQFETAPQSDIQIQNIQENNNDYWKQFETVENNFDKELFNNKADNYLNYDGPVIENRKSFQHGNFGKDLSISNYNPKNKLYNPYNPISNFIQGLKWIKELPFKAFSETNNQTEIADLEIKEMYSQMLGKDFSQDEKTRLDYLNSNVKKSITETIEKPVYKQKDPWTVSGALERLPHSTKYAYAAALKMLPFLYTTAKSGLKGGSIGAGIGAGSALVAGQLGPQAALPEELATVPAGTLAGFGFGARAGAAKRTFEIEAGLARNELKQINEEIINEGGIPLSNSEINGLSIAVGGVNAGLELISLKAMLKTIPGGNEILKKFEKKQLKELAKDKTIREQLNKVLKNYSTAVLTETTTETAQELTNIIAERQARTLGGVKNTPLEQHVSRIIDVTKEAFAATLFLGGVGSVAQTAKIYTLQGMDKETARKKAESMSFDERHNFINDNQNLLLDNIKNEPAVKNFEKEMLENEQAVQVSDKVFNDLKNANVSDEEAQGLGQLAGQFFKKIAEGDTKKRSALDIYNDYNITIKGGISKDVTLDKTPAETLNQSAMYRSPKENFADFYNQVFEKEIEAKNTGAKIQKSYYEYSNKDVYIRVKHDAVNHVENGHQLSADDWKNVLENITNIENAGISHKTFSKDNVALLKISTPKGKYGVALQFANGNNYIATAFKSTDKGIDTWIEKSSAKMLSNNPIASVEDKSSISDVILGQNSNKGASRAWNTSTVTTKGLLPSSASTDIINHIKENLKPRTTKYFQSAPPVNSSAFKEWFGDSKIVDENGRPLVVYHGTTANFNIFKANNASTDYGFPDGMYFSSSKEIAKTYGDYKHAKPMELYLKIENPLILEAGGKTYNAFYDELYSSVKNIDKNKYDGIIIKNIRDNWSQNDDGGEIATTYIAFKPEQIKSVNNQGTFDINNPDIYYQMIGENGANRLDSEILPKKLEQAKEMEQKGQLPTTIHELTGWFRGADKKWRYEISDNEAKIINRENIKYFEIDDLDAFWEKIDNINKRMRELVDIKDNKKISKDVFEKEYYSTMQKRERLFAEFKNRPQNNRNEYYLSDILDHKQLYKAYPHLKNLKIRIVPANNKFVGVYKRNSIGITEDVLKYGDLKATLIHEIQHYIQDAEDFNWGGNPETVEKQITKALDMLEKSETEKKRKELVQMAKEESRKTFVLGSALQTLRIRRKEDTIFKSWWWAKYGSWYVPRKTRKKEYRNFMNEWVEKYLNGVCDIMKDRGQLEEYLKYCQMDINEVRRLYKNSEARRNRIWKKTPEDIAYNFRNALDRLNTEGEYSKTALKTELYKMLAGEVEARNTAARMDMTEAERKDKHPRYTQEYDNENQLVVFSDGTTLPFSLNNPNNQYGYIYNQNNKNSNSSLYKQDNSEEYRGSISFFRDENGNIRKTLIDLVSGKADKSTTLHEFGHLFLQTLIVESNTNLKAREMLSEVNKWLGYNGKEYTQAQHEKFARGFEAYLASGKAPTYKLKQTFEKFAKWLKDIYLSIKYNTDIVLSPDAEKVFNKIFGENNLEETNKKKADILKRAKEFGEMRYKPTEEQIRFKNIAYDILATGLKRNPNWLKSVLESGSNTRAMQKKRERIEFDLRKIQDPYSSGSGMLPEWREFFTDPGVSYENNIAGADYELAQQAYDVIINRSWERTNEEYYELQQAENEYEYLLKEFKNAKNTDDRTNVLITYYDWLENIDEIVQEQYGERWVHDTNEIERFEQLNKFEQAKEILIKNSDLLKNSNGIAEYKNVVQAVLKQLNFLTSFERNKILGVVSEITSVEELKNNINEIMDFAETLQDVTARKNMSENIQKELMATKNIRKNGKIYGKYDYSTNKLFNKLRNINRLSREDAEAEYTTLLEEFEAMSEEQKESLSFEDKLYKKFITYKAHGNVYISSDFLSSLYQDIVFAKLQGKLSKNGADFDNRINNNAAIDKVLDRLEMKKPAKNITKFYTKFANLESFINLFLDKKFVDEYSVLFEETQVQAKSYVEKQSVLKEMANILNVKPFFIDDEIFKKLNEKYTFKDYSLKRPQNIELNKMQLIEAYIYSKNPIIKQRLINMFGKGGYDRIISLLNPDDIKIGDLLQRTAEKYYNPINRIYIKKYGIDMPKAKNYFPVSADVVQELDLFNQYTEQSITPKFFKTRTSSVFVPIKLSNPVQTLFTHIEKANNLILLEEKLSKLNRVFKDRTVKQFISDLYGEEAYNGFIKQISDCSYTKKAEMLGAVDSMINKLVNNTIVATISLKPKIAATQLVSVINFSENMPSALWFGGFVKALSNPKATIKFMMENEYLQQRFGEGAQNEALARIVKASDFHKSKKFIDFFSLNVKLGDIGAIIFGGKPYVDYLMQHKKMSKEEAFKQFVLEVNRAQQAATTSSLADYQKSTNPIFRLYYAFQNTTNQYFRKTADAIISRANGDISNAEMAKTILIYTVFNNFLYRMVANPYVWILGLTAGGDWEDFAKEVVNSIFDLNSQAIIGIGNLYQAILNALLDKPFYLTAKGLDKIPFDIHKIITEAKDGLENIRLDTWLNAVGDILDTSMGAPASTIINTASASANIADGQIGTAIMKVLGYSDYQAKRAFDIED